MTQASPLQWPAGKPRCKQPRPSRFSVKSIEACRRFLWKEISLLGGENIILSTNLVLRQDGQPYSAQRQPEDQGAAVYFKYNGRPMCFACDTWEKIQENIYAIGMTINALRGIERWGSHDMMEQAFTSFVALPPQRSAWDVLGIEPNSGLPTIEDAYKRLARKFHPDNQATGDANKMWELNDARERAKRLIA